MNGQSEEEQRPVSTTLKRRNGGIVTHDGQAGLIVSCGVSEGKHDHLAFFIELDIGTREEATAMIGTLLALLEAQYGQEFLQECLKMQGLAAKYVPGGEKDE